MTDTTNDFGFDLKLSLNRRSLLRRALATGAGAAARTAGAAPASRAARPSGLGYGPPGPVPDATTGLELLLPATALEHMSFGWRNDLMSDGVPLQHPRRHGRFPPGRPRPPRPQP